MDLRDEAYVADDSSGVDAVRKRRAAAMVSRVETHKDTQPLV